MKNTKSVRNVWYVSYVLVLLIPSIAALMVFHFASEALNEQIQETNRAFLQLLEQNVESSVEYTDRMADMLVVSQDFRAIRNISRNKTTANRYQLYRFINSSPIISMSDQFIHQQFIYLRNSHTVVTRTVYQDADKARSMALSEWAFTGDEYSELITSPQERRYLSSAIGPTPVVLYAQSLPYGSAKPDVTLVVAFSRSALLSVLDAAAWSGDGLVCVFNGDNDILLSSGSLRLDHAALSEGASVLGEGELSIGGQRYLYFNTGVKASGLRYVYVAPYEVIYQKARGVQIATVVAIVTGLIISLVLSGWLVRRHYTPVSNILDTLDQRELGGNEYERIARAIDQGNRERVDLGRRLEESRQLRAEDLLDGFLVGRLPNNDTTYRQLPLHGMPMDKPLHFVLCLRAEAENADLDEDELQDMATELFQIRLTEQLPDIDVYHGWRSGSTILVIGLERVQAPSLATVVQACQDAVIQALDIQVNTGLSWHTEGITQLPDRYRQADTALEFAQMRSDGRLVVYPEQPGPMAYYYQVEDELTIMQAVREGQPERVEQVLNTISNRYAHEPNVAMIQCLRFDLIATCYRVFAYADSLLPRESWYDEAVVARLNRAGGMVELTRCVRGILLDICEAIQGYRQGQSEDLSARIAAFVQTQWQDQGLSVAVVAEHFGMNVSYVSRMFKEQKGVGLLEYINRLRVDQSVALLRQGLPIAGVAEQCGFASDASFIRVFKQYMGTTPGKYREMGAEMS